MLQRRAEQSNAQPQNPASNQPTPPPDGLQGRPVTPSQQERPVTPSQGRPGTPSQQQGRPVTPMQQQGRPGTPIQGKIQMVELSRFHLIESFSELQHSLFFAKLAVTTYDKILQI